MIDEPRILGSLRADGDVGVVRIEDRYDTPIEDLWSALIDPERLARWYGEVSGDLQVDGRFTIYLPGPEIDAAGRVDSCDPPNSFTVLTRETDESAARGGAGAFNQTISATLTAQGDQTDLVVEIRGLPLGKIAAYGAGWQIHAENLAYYLAGDDPRDTQTRWSALAPHYEQQASTLA